MTNAPVLTSAHDTLYRHLRVEPHCDILIDRIAAADLGDELTIWQNPGESVALSDTLFATMPELSPLLLRLTLDDIELTEQLLDRAQTEAMTGSPTRSVCAFLFSRAPLAQLAKHLSTHLNAYMKVSVQSIFAISIRACGRTSSALPRPDKCTTCSETSPPGYAWIVKAACKPTPARQSLTLLKRPRPVFVQPIVLCNGNRLSGLKL